MPRSPRPAIYSLFIDATGKVKDSTTPDGIFLKDGIHTSHNSYVAMGDQWFKTIQPFLSPQHNLRPTRLDAHYFIPQP